MRQHNDPDVLSQALAEPSRRALLENLRYGQKTVTQLVEATQLKQPNVSNHLAKMRQQGIVRSERIGRQVYYSLYTPFADVLLQMHEMAANSANSTVMASAHSLASEPPTSAGKNGAAIQTGQISAHFPLDAFAAEHQAHADTHATPAETEHESAVTKMLAQSRNAYFAAVMAGDEEQAVTLINGLVAQRLPMETIYLEIFAKSINYIGELYRAGVTDEAHEHMASATTERIMARIAHFYTPVARVAYRAILGCVADNWHTLGLRMLTDGLKTLGWETLFLGANVPTPSFVAMAQSMQPDLVIISCAMEEQAHAARELLHNLDALRKTGGSPFQIAAGGHYFLEHSADLSHLPVDFTANDMQQFLQLVAERFSAEKTRN